MSCSTSCLLRSARMLRASAAPGFRSQQNLALLVTTFPRIRAACCLLCVTRKSSHPQVEPIVFSPSPPFPNTKQNLKKNVISDVYVADVVLLLSSSSDLSMALDLDRPILLGRNHRIVRSCVFSVGVFHSGNYGPPVGFCFDEACQDEPMMTDPLMSDYNVERRAGDFINACEVRWRPPCPCLLWRHVLFGLAVCFVSW